MRQLKFKAWDIKNKFYLMLDDKELFLNNYGLYERETRDYHGDEYVKVSDKYILEQFTGLLDNKGKEIYENDIADILTNSGVIKAVCVWNNDRACFEWLCNTYGRLNLSSVESEIFSNIHESPELGESK